MKETDVKSRLPEETEEKYNEYYKRADYNGTSRSILDLDRYYDCLYI